MRLVRFEHGGPVSHGRLDGENVVPVAGETLTETLTEALAGAVAGAAVPLASVRLLAPVARPGKILGIGVNYAAHAAESVSFVNTSKPEVQKSYNRERLERKRATEEIQRIFLILSSKENC